MIHLQNITLIKKISLILFLPLLLVSFFLVDHILENRKIQQHIQHQEYLALFCEKISNLIDEVNAEQNLQLRCLLQETKAESLPEIILAVDKNRQELDRFIADFKKHSTKEQKRFEEIFSAVTDALQQIDAIRKSISARSISFAECYAYYSKLSNMLLNNYNELPKWGELAALSNYLYCLAYLAAEQTYMIRGGFQMWKGAIEKKLSIIDFVHFDQNILLFSEYEELFTHLLSIPQRETYQSIMQKPDAIQFRSLAQNILHIGPDEPLNVLDSNTCWQDAEAFSQLIQEMEDVLTLQLHDSVAQLKAKAVRDITMSCIALVLFFLLIALITKYVIYFIHLQLKEIINKLEKIIEKDLTQQIALEGKDEFGLLAKIINNRVLHSLKDMLMRMKNSSSKLQALSSNLRLASDDVAITSNMQNDAAQQIVHTMENTDQLAQEGGGRVRSVLQEVLKSQEEIERGLALVQENQNNMQKILLGNTTTIEAIHNLSRHITGIWDIVNIINHIADQTKIIAFNAELEASSAGEAGRSFQIVATEIRRLADSTAKATSDIKTKIYETQKSSQLLTSTAESGSLYIKEGEKLSGHLNHIFQNVQQVSQSTLISSKEVVHSIQKTNRCLQRGFVTDETNCKRCPAVEHRYQCYDRDDVADAGNFNTSG